MIIIPVIKGNINRALKIFKTKFKKTGILEEIKQRKQYTKNSTKTKLQKEKIILKQKYKLKNNE